MNQEMLSGFGEAFVTDNTNGNRAYPLILRQAEQGEAPYLYAYPAD